MQRTHQDRCRCIQVHPLRMCPPFPVRACAFGLYLIQLYLVYYSMFFSFVKFSKILISTYSNPQDRSRTDLGSQPHCAVPPVMPALPHNAVFSRLSSEVISLVQPLTANRQHEEEVKRIIRPSLIFSFILSQERTKVKSKSFVSENLCEKLLPTFSSATFRIFLGHRCILNLPYVLRIRVLICRSPSHQPSA